MTISESIQANVRAVLLSKTDGSGVLVSTFLRDYKSIIGEPLMYKNMGYSNLEDFIKDLPEVCRLNYSEKDMAYKLYGIAKPNTYASSFMKRAEGNSATNSGDNNGNRQRRGRSNKGDKVQQNSNMDEDWKPNDRGHISLCFPNDGTTSKEDVVKIFAEVGEPAEINIIQRLIFVRYEDQAVAKKAVQMFGDSLRLRRADERSKKGSNRGPRSSTSATSQNQNNNAKYSPDSHNNNNDDEWDEEPAPPAKITYSKQPSDHKDTVHKETVHKDTLHPQKAPSETVQVYMGNLPNEMTQTDLESLASPYDNTGAYLKHQDGNKTYAFVHFGSIAAGKKMIDDLHELVIKGRTLKVRFANRDLSNAMSKDREANTLSPKSSSECPAPKGSIERQFEEMAIHRGHESKPPPLETDIHRGHESRPPPLETAIHRGHDSKPPPLETAIHRGHESRPPPLETITRTVTRNNVQTNTQPGGYPHSVNMYSPASQTSGGHHHGHSPAKMPPLERNMSRNGYQDPDMPPLETVEPQKRRRRKDEGRFYKGHNDLDDMPPLEKTELPRSQDLSLFDTQSRLAGDEAIQLFIGNFPYGTKEEDLFAILAPYGIINLTMMNKETQNRSTYAFATCCNLMYAEKAIEVWDQSFFRGRRLTVTLANPVSQSQLPSPASSNNSLSFIGGPVANITCTVGGQRRDAGRQVQVEEAYNGPPPMGPMQSNRGVDSRYSNRNANYNHAYNDRQAPAYNDRQAPAYNDRQAPAYNDRQAPAYNDRQAPAYNDRQAPAYNDRQASAYNDRRAPHNYNDAPVPVVKAEYNYKRITRQLMDYSKVVSKLRGEEMVVNPPGTTLAVMITQVDSDRVFWGQVIKDSVSGDNLALQKLTEVTQMLQDESVRTIPIKGMGRCTAMYKGEWFRAWCTHILHRDGQDFCDLLFVDYGNTEQVPKQDVFCTNTRLNDIWCLPPMARPFKLHESKYDLESMTDNLAVLEVLEQGSSFNNFVSTVIGKFDHR